MFQFRVGLRGFVDSTRHAHQRVVRSSHLIIASADNGLSAATVCTNDETDTNRTDSKSVDVVDTLERAIAIHHTEEMTKSLALLLKEVDTTNINDVISALSAEVDRVPTSRRWWRCLRAGTVTARFTLLRQLTTRVSAPTLSMCSMICWTKPQSV